MPVSLRSASTHWLNHHSWQIAATRMLTTRTARPRIYLLRRALHPIRRHYTPSVRIQRHITGAAPRNGCSARGSSPIPSTHRPHFHLFQEAAHPIRRHYTPSVRVQRHITGAAPHNGCSASDSSPAHQSTRNGDNAEALLKHIDNYRGQPRQRSHASHRPHFHLFQEAAHPIRRHYTPSVRVQRHITGAAPHNGCSASDSSSGLARPDLSVAPRAPGRRRAPGQAFRSPATRLRRPRQGPRSDRRGAPSTAPPRAHHTRQRR